MKAKLKSRTTIVQPTTTKLPTMKPIISFAILSTALVALTFGVCTGHVFGERPSELSPATSAILITLSPETLPNLRLAEYLSGAREDFSESDIAKASPVLAKATRTKVNEPK